MYSELNINPEKRLVGDCVVRAIGVVTDKDWDDVFLDLALKKGFVMKQMPSENNVWGSYLHDLGFKRHVIEDTCPDCYTVKDFVRDHPKGRFVLCTGTHAIGVVDGTYYDTADTGDEAPQFYFEKEKENDK